MIWGKVLVEGLRLDASIGILDHEHERRQPLIVDLVLEVASGAPIAGDIASVYDYRRAADHARKLVNAGHIELVETFAEDLAQACLTDTVVETVTVRARKPDAIADADAVGVEIVRRRKQV